MSTHLNTGIVKSNLRKHISMDEVKDAVDINIYPNSIFAAKRNALLLLL